MAEERVDIAVIGLSAAGEQTLRALGELPEANIVGVADKDGDLAQRVGAEMNVPHYTDNRSLLVEVRPRAVFLAVPSMAAPEILAACAEREIHVWKESPLARDLNEGVAMVQRMEQAGVKFAVGTQWRFAPGYHHARQSLGRLGPVFLARGHYLFNWGPRLSWRGDRASAGGGALLDLGYHPLDLMIWMLGLPEDVYGVASAGHRETEDLGGEPLAVYDTDDTAAAVLRYRSGAMATVVTCRASGPMSQELNLHGRGGSLQANSELCIARDPEGNIVDHTPGEPSSMEAYRRQAEAFLHAVASDAACYESSARESLLTQAAVDAIYLASRTGQPESPTDRLKNCSIEPEDCLIHRPPQTPPSDGPTGASCNETE